MFRIIHPNRWLIWTLAIAVMVAIALLGAIERFAIEQEVAFSENVLAPTQEQRSVEVSYDKNNWRVVKSIETDVDADGKREFILLLSSIIATGQSGTGGDLYDMDLLIAKDGDIIYDFEPRDEYERFFMSGVIEIKDITDDSIPEIIFYSGSQIGANDWHEAVHILHYLSDLKTFRDVAVEDFYDSLLHKFIFADFGNGPFPITSKGIKDNPAIDCHTCVAYYKYTIYKWNGNDFIIDRVINSRRLSDSINARSLEYDLDYIRSKFNQ